MQHIKIRNFGPIKEVDIDLNKEMEIVIGPQASGKSTFSKTIYFCKKIRDYFIQYLDIVMNNEYWYSDELYVKFLKFIRQPFMGYFGTTKHMQNFEIEYYYEVESKRFVKIGLDKDHYAKFKFSSEMEEDIRNMIKQAVEVAAHNTNVNEFAQTYFQQQGFIEKMKIPVKKIFCDDDKLIYIPAGRNLLAIVPEAFSKKSTVLEDENIDITQIDLITQEFIQYIKGAKSEFGSKLDEMTQNYIKTVKGQIKNHDVEMARLLIRNILCADYINDKDGEKLFYDKEHWVKLMFGSSGQQEIVWALNTIFLAILKNEKTFMVFEEPESHLFPDSQAEIAKLVALMIHSNGSRVIITTHSPYMLTAVNLLIYSGEEEKNSNENSVITKEFRLKPRSVGAYFITRSTGRFENIIGETEKLIDALAIDGISDEINEKMDEILRKSINNEKGRKNDL